MTIWQRLRVIETKLDTLIELHNTQNRTLRQLTILTAKEKDPRLRPPLTIIADNTDPDDDE